MAVFQEKNEKKGFTAELAKAAKENSCKNEPYFAKLPKAGGRARR